MTTKKSKAKKKIDVAYHTMTKSGTSWVKMMQPIVMAYIDQGYEVADKMEDGIQITYIFIRK